MAKPIEIGLASSTHLGVVLPTQHFASLGQSPPEQRLMVAVLHDALDCVEKHRGATHPHGQQLYRRATRWFLAADEADWPYSFEHICGTLDLDSDAVLERLRLARSEQIGKSYPPGTHRILLGDVRHHAERRQGTRATQG